MAGGGEIGNAVRPAGGARARTLKEGICLLLLWLRPLHSPMVPPMAVSVGGSIKCRSMSYDYKYECLLLLPLLPSRGFTSNNTTVARGREERRQCYIVLIIVNSSVAAFQC